MRTSGVEAAIRELGLDIKRIKRVIAVLRRIETRRGTQAGKPQRKRLSVRRDTPEIVNLGKCFW